MACVSIHLYASFRACAGGAPEVQLEVEPGETIQQVLERLGVPVDKTRIVFVDNRAAELSHPLSGGERVGVFPAIGGG